MPDVTLVDEIVTVLRRIVDAHPEEPRALFMLRDNVGSARAHHRFLRGAIQGLGLLDSQAEIEIACHKRFEALYDEVLARL